MPAEHRQRGTENYYLRIVEGGQRKVGVAGLWTPRSARPALIDAIRKDAEALGISWTSTQLILCRPP